DTVCEILLQTDLQALMIYHWPPERVKYLEDTFKHPLQMTSTDGIYVGKKPHPRGYGTYPKELGEFSRDNKWMDFEEAIYKISEYPATKFNVKKRGILKEDYFADLVIFDPETVAGPATFEESRKEPIGINYVLVNGNIAMKDGKATED